MEGSWRKPEARMVKSKAAPAASSAEAEEALEAQELAESRARLQRQTQEDKIGALIGGKMFVTNWTDPILLHPIAGAQLSVSRYYPEVGIAVDIFPYLGEIQAREIQFKRRAFKESAAHHAGQEIHVKYAALSYSDQLASIIPQIEA